MDRMGRIEAIQDFKSETIFILSILSILVNCLRRSLTLTRVLALRASVERQAEPEFPEDCEHDQSGYDRDELRLSHLEHDDVHVAAESERERDERRDQNLRSEAVEVLSLLSALDEPVVGRGRHQKHDGQRRQAD